MVVLADDAAARQVRLLRNQGMERRYANEIVGFNMRMTDVHAAIGRAQLRRLPEWTEQRRRNAAYLTRALEPVAAETGLVPPRIGAAAEPVWHQYTVRVPHRDEVVAALGAAGVPVGVYYPTPIHRLPAYDLDLDLPQTAAAAAEVVSLPVHPAVPPGGLDRVAAAVAEAMAA
jgi:dTDP-4-amino-4,6-dideoxygalactose transaminase